MKKSIFYQTIILIFVIMLFQFSSIKAQEEIVFDGTIDWEWPLDQWYGGNSFYWWHNHETDPAVIDFGNMPTDNWKTPYDYENGNFYLRFTVLDQPSDEPFFIQYGIWQDGGYSECISNDANLSGGTGSSVEMNIGSPADWWQKNYDDLVDFTRPQDIAKMGFALWKSDGYCIPMAQGWNSPSACENAETEALKFFPMQARVTLVAVPAGHTFSGWGNYPTDDGNRQPTPTYAIDYINKLTDKVVPSTDEYSYSSNMSGATSGSGSKLSLLPGQDVYFRTKAIGELLESRIQHLIVPDYPAAPNFTYDANNQRTVETVSSQYEYSDHSDMSGAVSGTGNYVNLSLGSTKYFRKKATASSFESNVQTLVGTEVTGSPEFVIINQTIEFGEETDAMNGFYFFYYNSSMPKNWLTPYDFYHGQIYTRYKIISEKSSEPIALAFGIWQKIPQETGTLYETMDYEYELSGPGDIQINNSSLSDWWTYNGGVDFSQMDIVWHFGINPWNVDPYEQIRSEKPTSWNIRYDKWYPMQVEVTVVAVANGYEFSGWDNYVSNEGEAPNYAIDYIGAQTSTNVISSDEYSYNQTSWTSGANAKLSLTPGQDVYFRKKAYPTLIQHLTVAARPSAPAFGIDYANERTSSVVSSDYEYSVNSNMSSAVTGVNSNINLTPGTSLYFRKKATVSSFASEIQSLSIPARPAAPEIGINFQTESTSSISSDYIYSVYSNMSSSSSGSGAPVALAPGETLYIQKKATADAFKSGIQNLVAPDRPEEPQIGINYTSETTNAISTSYIYSSNSDMSGYYTGTGSGVALAPGTTLYIQKKATESAYKSLIQQLTAPVQPNAPVVGIDYVSETTDIALSSNYLIATQANMSNAYAGNGTKIAVTPGTDIYIRQIATENKYASSILNLNVPARPVVSLLITSPTSLSPIPVEIVFEGAVSGFSISDPQIVNGTAANLSFLTNKYQIQIIPIAAGSIQVTIPANIVVQGNFISNLLSFEYKVPTNIGQVNAKENSYLVYPTLVSEYLNVKIASSSSLPAKYEILNILGAQVANGNLEKDFEQIPVNDLEKGSYIIRFISERGISESLKFNKM